MPVETSAAASYNNAGMDNSQAVISLAALAHASRLAVFRWLVECGPDGAYPGDIAQKLGIPQATLSFHLKELHRAGLVGSEQIGRFVRYTVDFDAMQALLAFLNDNCCGGNPARCAPKTVAVASIRKLAGRRST